jgi:hypothetical protein
MRPHLWKRAAKAGMNGHIAKCPDVDELKRVVYEKLHGHGSML